MHWRLGFMVITALGLFTTAAQAERPFTEKKASLSGHLGYGIDLDDGNLNPYGFGMGARGGYTFDPNIYVGGLFDFFFGESDTTSAFGGSATASARSWIFQVEGGYDFGVTRTIVLRPKMGLGMTSITGKGCVSALGLGETCATDTDTDFTFGLGGEALFDLGPVYLAPEMRFNLGGDVSALIFMVGVGGTL
jgi:outer membrane autotransporter protein